VLTHDAIVVGGGPAGAVAARLLGEAGLDVVLLEKERFPRVKVCGEGIVGKAVQVLETLGLADGIEGLPHVGCRQVTAFSPDGMQLTLPLPKADAGAPPAYICRREHFDQMLLEGARPFVQVRERVQVDGLIREGGRVIGVHARDVEREREESLQAPIVIGADGARGVVARGLGVPKHNPRFLIAAGRSYYRGVERLGDGFEIHYHRALLPGYAWLFPLPDGVMNVGLGVPVADLKRRGTSLPHLREQVLTDGESFARRLQGAEVVGPWRGWMIPTASGPRQVGFDGALLLGDAAGLVDPFTGGGLGHALHSAQIAATAVIEGKRAGAPPRWVAARYQRRLWRQITASVYWARVLRRAARSPRFVDFLFGRPPLTGAVRWLLQKAVH